MDGRAWSRRPGVALVLVAGAIALAGCGGRSAGEPVVTPLAPEASPAPGEAVPAPGEATPAPGEAGPAPGEAAPPEPPAPPEAPARTGAPSFVEPGDPAALDAAAIGRVLQGIHAVEGAAERAMLAAGEATPATTAFLEATRGAAGERAHRAVLRDSTFDPAEREQRGLARVPGDRIVVRVEVLDVDPDGRCVWTEAEEDLSARVPGTVRNAFVYYALVAQDPARDPDGLNPTGWVIHWQGGRPDRTRVEPPPVSRCPGGGR